MSNTAPSRADPVVVFPLGRWCPPQKTSQPHPPPCEAETKWTTFHRWQFQTYFFFNENVWISIKISLKFVPKGPIDIPALVQIMAWRHPGDKPLSEPMIVSLPMDICVTQPQWVNPYHVFRDYTLNYTNPSPRGERVKWDLARFIFWMVSIHQTIFKICKSKKKLLKYLYLTL